jgi:ABC-type dipeptide/oligopeptide/nickel transport system permease component
MERIHQRLILLPFILTLIALVHLLLLDILPGGPEGWIYATTDPESLLDVSFPSVFEHFWSLLRFDLGQSYFLQKPVSELIYHSLAQSFILTLGCFLGLYPIAISLAVALSHNNHWASKFIYNIFMMISCIPSCLIYTLLAIFGYNGWLTTSPQTFAAVFLITRRVAALTSLSLKHLTLEKNKPYIEMAYHRNVSRYTIYVHYILKNGLRAIWVRAPKHFCQVLATGTLMAELLFSIPGFGQLSFLALQTQDYPLILGCVLTASFAISLSFMLCDTIHHQLFLKKI